VSALKSAPLREAHQRKSKNKRGRSRAADNWMRGELQMSQPNKPVKSEPCIHGLQAARIRTIRQNWNEAFPYCLLLSVFNLLQTLQETPEKPAIHAVDFGLKID
jgi:hypothetical protein